MYYKLYVMAKKELILKPKGQPETPSMDSVKVFSKLLDGKKFDPSKSVSPRIASLMTKHVAPLYGEDKPVADSIYDANKLKDPEYPGVSAKELDPLTKGKGKQFIEVSQAYQKYRNAASPKDKPLLAPTKQGEKDKPQPRFGDVDYSKEALYVKDPFFKGGKAKPEIKNPNKAK